MKLSLSTSSPVNGSIVVPVFSDGNILTAGGLSSFKKILDFAREDGFSGKRGETYITRPPDRFPAPRVMLVGMGGRAESDGVSYRLAAAAVGRRLSDTQWGDVSFLLPEGPLPPSEALRTLGEGILLSGYQYHQYKSESVARRRGVTGVHFVTKTPLLRSGGLARVTAAIDAVNYCRDLINQPPSEKTPLVLCRLARALAGPLVKVTIHGNADLRRMGAQALLGVNRGSAHPAALVHLHYRPRQRARARVAMVGKGVTFDSGGLSLKTAEGMMTMKYDMAGAAIVFSLFQALSRLTPAVEVHGVAALTENMPGPNALKPGDVLRAMNGKTIEVLNTDAEGRLILADALSFAARLPVDRVIDVATLTGAATVALGKAYGALLTDSRELEADLRQAAGEAGENLWPLPLEKSYEDHIQSKVADLKNIGLPGEAGTIIGGLFLKHFSGGKEWAHVDMAGVGWNGSGSLLSPPGATGALVRTFIHYLLRAGGAS